MLAVKFDGGRMSVGDLAMRGAKGVGDAFWVAPADDYTVIFAFDVPGGGGGMGTLNDSASSGDVLRDELSYIFVYDHGVTEKDKANGTLSRARAEALASSLTTLVYDMINESASGPSGTSAEALAALALPKTPFTAASGAPHVLANVLARVFLPHLTSTAAAQVVSPGLATAAARSSPPPPLSAAATAKRDRFAALFGQLNEAVKTHADVARLVEATARAADKIVTRDSSAAAKACAMLVHAADARQSTFATSKDRVRALWDTGADGLRYYKVSHF